MDIHLIPLNEFKSEIIDGCIYLSSNVRENLQDLVSSKKIHLNFEGNFIGKGNDDDHLMVLVIPVITLDENIISDLSLDQLRTLLEPLSAHEDFIRMKMVKSAHVRILLCFMCGGEKNDVEIFFAQLSSRFSVIVTNQSSFIVNTFIDRSNRKVRLSRLMNEHDFVFRLNSFLFHSIRYSP